jgi:hypothetical protein
MWWIALILGIGLSIVSFLLAPRPKQPPPPAVKDMDEPTAEAGRPIPVVFGTVIVKGLNVLHWSDKATHEYDIQV